MLQDSKDIDDGPPSNATLSMKATYEQGEVDRDDITVATQETADAAHTVLGGKKEKLPPAVREKVEDLFHQLNQPRTGAYWKRTDEDRATIVQIAGLLHEYANGIPELFERTDKKVKVTTARQLLEKFSSVSALEERVIQLLLSEYVTITPNLHCDKGTRRDITPDQKRYCVAVARLLRKRELGTKEMRAFCVERGLAAQTVTDHWEKPFKNENGVPLSITENLIPEVFARARKELQGEIFKENASLPQGDNEADGGNDDDEDSIDDPKTMTETTIPDDQLLQGEQIADALQQLLVQNKTIGSRLGPNADI